MSAHTPGPWRVIEDRPSRLGGMAHVRLSVSVGTDEWTIADVFNIDTPERQANAHLIAAAPELLAACEMLLDFHVEVGGELPDDALAELRHAVSRAHGNTAILDALEHARRAGQGLPEEPS
jgi:hypothetical protein